MNDIDILYRDSSVIVCLKPVGLDAEHDLPALLGPEVRCVHRLDKAVGGVMVYARTEKAASSLSRQIAQGSLTKEYLAMLCGIPETPEGELRDLLYHDARKNKTYVVDRQRAGVREAVLRYRVQASGQTPEGQPVSLVRIRLLTGRTHQIRAQFASRKLPLCGDGRYGSPVRQGDIALWSRRVGFRHPGTGKEMEFTGPMPREGVWGIFEEIPEDLPEISAV